MSNVLIKTFVAALAVVAFQDAFAAYSPVSISVAPPVQFPTKETSVTGVRLSALWGRHRDLYGLDLGVLGNVTDQDFVGLGLAGGFNLTHGMTTALGLQAAGLANINTKSASVYGFQIAGLLNKNTGSSSVNGIQFAAVNLADHTVIRGAQIGIYNVAQTVYGFQIGLINRVDNLYGLQIGLANFHHKGLFAVSPVLNIGW